MRSFLMALIIAYTCIACIAIWVSVLISGFLFLFTPFSFMYTFMPLIGLFAIYFTIKQGFNMIGKITE